MCLGQAAHGRQSRVVDVSMHCRKPQLKRNPGSVSNCSAWNVTPPVRVSVSSWNMPLRVFKRINDISYTNPGKGA